MTFDYKKYLAAIITIFLLKIVILGIYPFHHPSEARYASIAMRMELTGNYLMPYFDIAVPFFGKPPLAFWVSALSFKLFGFNHFAARLPHLLALMTVCFLLHRCVAKISDKKTAIISVLILCSCLLFYSLHSVMTEAFLLLGMTLITTSFWLQIQSEKPKNIDGYLFFLGCVISMLTKGPAAILMPCLPIFFYLLITAEWKKLVQKFPIFSGTLVFSTLALPWFFLAEMQYHGFLKYFFVGENFDRFTKAGWSGDIYGHAHKVAFGSIWFFCLVLFLPTNFLFFLKPKQIWSVFIEKVKDKKNPAFLFFFISFMVPLVVLTFMRNMIMTYAVFCLVPFAVIIAFIIVKKNWYQFTSFLLCSTVVLHFIVIAVFLKNPSDFAQRFNRQDYLIKHIPKEKLEKPDFEIYYLGLGRNNFSLNWYAKDRVKSLNNENFAQVLSSAASKKYIIGSVSKYQELLPQFQSRLRENICIEKNHECLYESAN